MNTEYINHNDEPRILTKFEKECLKDWYWNELLNENRSEENYEKWYESMSWSDIDEIMSYYTK